MQWLTECIISRGREFQAEGAAYENQRFPNILVLYTVSECILCLYDLNCGLCVCVTSPAYKHLKQRVCWIFFLTTQPAMSSTKLTTQLSSAFKRNGNHMTRQFIQLTQECSP